MNSLLKVKHLGVILISVLVSLQSCSKKTYLRKGTVYQLQNPSLNTAELVKYKVTGSHEIGTSESISSKDSHSKLVLTAKPASFIEQKPRGAYRSTNRADFTLDYFSNGVYFTNYPEAKDDPLKIRQIGGKGKLTAITVTAKRRAKWTGGDTVSDNIPESWDTGFSPGFAYTWPLITWKTLNSKTNESSVSIDLGPLFTIGKVGLSNKNTWPKYTSSRNALSVSCGAILNLGINKFDFGLFTGADRALGTKSSDWVYQGKWGWGFILGYDLVKPK